MLYSDSNQLEVYGQRTISNLKAMFQQEFSEPLNLILTRSLAYTNDSYRLMNYLSGLDYYNFILSLEKKLDSNPKEVISKLTTVRDKMFRKSNLIVLFAGNKKSQKLFAKSLPILTEELSKEQLQKPNYVLPKPARREAFTTNSEVQYMAVNSDMLENGISLEGKHKVIASFLTNVLLIPEIRLKGGTYGAEAGIIDTNYINYTYRDNNFVQSLATIQNSGSFLNQIAPLITQADLTVTLFLYLRLQMCLPAN